MASPAVIMPCKFTKISRKTLSIGQFTTQAVGMGTGDANRQNATHERVKMMFVDAHMHRLKIGAAAGHLVGLAARFFKQDRQNTVQLLAVERFLLFVEARLKLGKAAV